MGGDLSNSHVNGDDFKLIFPKFRRYIKKVWECFEIRKWEKKGP